MDESSVLSLATLVPLLLEVTEEGGSAAVLTALGHPVARAIGARILVTESGVVGSLLDPAADQGAVELARRALAQPGWEAGPHTLPLEDGGELTVFLELHHPQAEMVIVGAGHVAQPLCTLGSLLGLRVSVLDDRPLFATPERFPEAREVRKVDFFNAFADMAFHPWSHVVLVTRGHRYDFECLRQLLLRSPLPGYIGMIGSRRRVKATFQALLAEGLPRDKLRLVHAPIGLDIRGETPAEIAVAVAAEVVLHWRGGTGAPLAHKEAVLDRLLPPADGEDTSAP